VGEQRTSHRWRRKRQGWEGRTRRLSWFPLSGGALSYYYYYYPLSGGQRAGGLNSTALGCGVVETAKAHVYVYITVMISNGRILRLLAGWVRQKFNLLSCAAYLDSDNHLQAGVLAVTSKPLHAYICTAAG